MNFKHVIVLSFTALTILINMCSPIYAVEKTIDLEYSNNLSEIEPYASDRQLIEV